MMKLSELVEAQGVISDVAMMLDHHGEHEMADRLQAVAERLRAAGNGAAAVPEGLIDLLREIRPKHGAVGSRDVDVTEQQRKIDAAIAMLAAAPAANAQPADDGECRSCVDGKCFTGLECVTLGYDAQPAEPVAQAEQPSNWICHAKFDDGERVITGTFAAEPAQQPQEALPQGEAVSDEEAALHLREWIKQGKLPEGVVPFVEMAIDALSRAPVPEAGLTDEQILQANRVDGCEELPIICEADEDIIRFARAILAAAKGGKQ